MSDYVKEKVLRIPFEKTGWDEFEGDYCRARDYFEYEYPDLFDYSTKGKFQFAPTDENYIDYVIDVDRDAYEGEYGKIRDLLPSEKEKVYKLFEQIMPNADFSAIRVVEFCWYNCCEAPDYYDYSDDAFYKEIKLGDL
jgi:hypothetical protein